MIGRVLKTFIAFLAAALIVAALAFLTYSETRPERRILVEENYQPPERPQTAQPTPQSADDLMTPMLEDE